MKRHQFSLFILVVFFFCLISCGKKENKNLDLTPRVLGVNIDLAKAVINSDSRFFQTWKSNKDYHGYILEICNVSEVKDFYSYAEQRYKSILKEERYKGAKSLIRYVLYCADTKEVCIRIQGEHYDKLSRAIPGAYYSLCIRKYKAPSECIIKLRELEKKSEAEIENMGFFKAMGITNPMIRTLELALNKAFIPSNGFIHRLVFYLPFGASIVGLRVFGSVIWSAVFFLLLYLSCSIGYLKRIAREKKNDGIAWMIWTVMIMAFLSFCCLVNSYAPSPDFRYAMTHFGYAGIFEKYYVPLYGTTSTSYSSTGFVIILTILFCINGVLSFIRKQADKPDEQNQDGDDTADINPLESIITFVAGAIVCQSYLGYVFGAFLLARIINNLLFFKYLDEKPSAKTNNKKQYWPTVVAVSLVILSYFFIPLVRDMTNLMQIWRIVFTTIWGVLATAGAALFIVGDINHLSWKKTFVWYHLQTMPQKDSLFSHIGCDIFYVAGLLSPLYFLLLAIMALTSNMSSDAAILFLCTAVLLLFYAPIYIWSIVYAKKRVETEKAFQAAQWSTRVIRLRNSLTRNKQSLREESDAYLLYTELLDGYMDSPHSSKMQEPEKSRAKARVFLGLGWMSLILLLPYIAIIICHYHEIIYRWLDVA